MAKRKVPVCITAAKASLWFCDDDHLHIELTDHSENPVAEIALDFEDGIEVIADLVAELGFNLVDPDDEESEGDIIGPVMGHC